MTQKGRDPRPGRGPVTARGQAWNRAQGTDEPSLCLRQPRRTGKDAGTRQTDADNTPSRTRRQAVLVQEVLTAAWPPVPPSLPGGPF